MSERRKNQMCKDYLMHMYIPSAAQVQAQKQNAVGNAIRVHGQTANAIADKFDAYHQSDEYKSWKKIFNREYYQAHKEQWKQYAMNKLRKLKSGALPGVSRAIGAYKTYANKASRFGESMYKKTHKNPSAAQQKANQLAKQFQMHNEMYIDQNKNKLSRMIPGSQTSEGMMRAEARRKLYR